MPRFSERTIDSFKTQMKGGGARSNLFEVSFGKEQGGTTSPVLENLGISLENSDLMLIKSAGLPASTITFLVVSIASAVVSITALP